ncbi:MAG: hypothetical protein KTR32_40090, partial [Granulosicoccus sp.]|nr:hypothetical protein [Granulosicoccus sp.]
MINNPPSIVPRAVSYLLLAAFAMLAVLVYWPALSGPFLLDDLINIPQTRVDALSVEQLREVALGNDSGRFGRSIPVLTFALNYYFGGDGTFSFKLVNLALHLCNALVLFFLLSSLLRVIKSGHESEGTILQSVDVRLFSVLIAGIWMLHPLQLSAVMYVVQRMNMLSTFFTLLSLLLFVSLRTAQIQGTKAMSLRASLPAATGVLLLVLFACLSKENGALAILYIGWIEFVVFRFRMNRETVHYRYRNSVIAGGVMLFCLGCLYFYLNQASLLHGYVIRDHSLVERLMTQPGVVLFYIRQILLPDMGQMSLYIDDFGVARELGLKTVLSIAGIVLLGLVTLLARRSHPLI